MRGGWFKVYTIAYLIFLYAPIALLPIFAFNDATVIAFPLSGGTTRWFGKLWEEPELHRALKNSLIIAVSSSLMATALGIFVSVSYTHLDVYKRQKLCNGLI